MGKFHSKIDRYVPCKGIYATLTIIPNKDSPDSLTLHGIHNCKECKCFDIKRMDFAVAESHPSKFPDNYPEQSKPVDGRLKFQELTWLDGIMDETIQTAFDGIDYTDWLIDSFKMFLQTHCCINAKYTRLILDHATITKELLKVNDNTTVMHPGDRQCILASFHSNSPIILLYQKLKSLLCNVYVDFI